MPGGATHVENDDSATPASVVLSVISGGLAIRRTYHDDGRTSMVCSGQAAMGQRGLDLMGLR